MSQTFDYVIIVQDSENFPLYFHFRLNPSGLFPDQKYKHETNAN